MKLTLYLFWISFLLCPSAWAARPFITDDAKLTTEGSCQLESWMRVYSGSREFWALPACNPTGNLEITLGGGLSSPNGGSSSGDGVFQFKSLYQALSSNSWGLGLAVGTIRHPNLSPGPNGLGNHYAYLPFSISFNDDKFILHSNLGWMRDRASSQNRTTLGVGGEVQLSPKLNLMAETFGDDSARPFWQTGLRYFIVPNLFQVDATIGQQFGGERSGRWISLGLRWTPDRVF